MDQPEALAPRVHCSMVAPISGLEWNLMNQTREFTLFLSQLILTLAYVLILGLAFVKQS